MGRMGWMGWMGGCWRLVERERDWPVSVSVDTLYNQGEAGEETNDLKAVEATEAVDASRLGLCKAKAESPTITGRVRAVRGR